MVELRRLRHSLRAKDRSLARVVAAEHETPAIVLGNAVLPERPHVAVVHDSRSYVPLRIVDRRHLGPVRADVVVGGWHELHDAACADPALRGGRQPALGHSLRLEQLPIESDTEVSFRIFLEVRVVPVGGSSLRCAAHRASRARQRDECSAEYGARCGAHASAQLRARPTMSAIAMNSAAMKIATATFP